MRLVGTCVGDVAGVAVVVNSVPFCMHHQIRAALGLIMVRDF